MEHSELASIENDVLSVCAPGDSSQSSQYLVGFYLSVFDLTYKLPSRQPIVCLKWFIIIQKNFYWHRIFFAQRRNTLIYLIFDQVGNDGEIVCSIAPNTNSQNKKNVLLAIKLKQPSIFDFMCENQCRTEKAPSRFVAKFQVEHLGGKKLNQIQLSYGIKGPPLWRDAVKGIWGRTE